MRPGRFQIGEQVSVEATDDGSLLFRSGCECIRVPAAQLVRQLYRMGAFACDKPGPMVQRMAKSDALAVVDAWNVAFKKDLAPARNARFAERALLNGFSVDDLKRVFSAIREQKTESCRWLHRDGKKYLDFEHCTRPPYKRDGNDRKGLAYKILEELDSPQAQVRRVSDEEI